MSDKNTELSQFTVLLKKKPDENYYTSHIEGIPMMCAKGETEEEAFMNLGKLWYGYSKFEEQQMHLMMREQMKLNK